MLRLDVPEKTITERRKNNKGLTMKNKLYVTEIGKTAMNCCLILLIQTLVAPIVVRAEQTNSQDVISQLDKIEKLTDQERATILQDNGKRLHHIQEILLSELASRDDESKCFAVYLLGEYRFPQAADRLAKIITLKAKVRENSREWFWDINPVVEALIKIGNPSIPAVVRNLAESDNADVRSLSLKVLCRIDGDKDIVQLRLQKAIAAQKDSNKKARLQAALKALADSAFEK
jgi:HEAT repeat protein